MYTVQQLSDMSLPEIPKRVYRTNIILQYDYNVHVLSHILCIIC